MRRLVPGLGGVKLDPVPGFLIRTAQGAPAGGGDDLVAVVGDRRVVAEAARLSPFICRAHGLGGVLDEQRAVGVAPCTGGRAASTQRRQGCAFRLAWGTAASKSRKGVQAP